MRERAEIEELWQPVIYSAHLARVAARWGISAAQLLEGTSISEETLANPAAFVVQSDVARIARRALALTGEPALGFYHGLEVKLSAHGPVGAAVLTSATLRDALEVVERFFSLRTHHVAFSHVVDGGEIVMRFDEVRPLEDLRVFFFESILTSFIQIAKSMVGQPVAGRVEVAFPEPAHFQGFAHLWPGPVRFGRPANRIAFPAALLDLPIMMSDPLASARAVRECEDELARLGETSTLLARVRRQMKSRTQGFPSLTELASLQHVSPRTMKRQLAAHGTSFQSLLDELRRDRALELLEVDDACIEDVAVALGYSDPSNFNRAFKRWMGEAPSEWKRRNAS